MGTMDESDGATSPSMIGNELRHRREAAGLSQDDLAQRIQFSRSHVQAVEKGRRAMTKDMAAALDAFFDTDGLFTRLRRDAAKQTAPWPSFRPWSHIEQDATRLRGYELAMMPGLFQTRGYAAVQLRDDEDAIAARLERQELFARDNPPTVRYLLDEWVLRRPVGGAAVMAEQLERLLEIVDERLATIQIVPSEAIPFYSGSFVLATADDETLGYEETTTQGVVVTRRQEVLGLEQAYDTLAAEALPASTSVETIRRIKEQWTS